MSFLIKKLTTILCLSSTISMGSLYADWEPEYCFPDEDLSILDDLIFQTHLTHNALKII